MSTPELPDDERSTRAVIPHWAPLLYWPVGFLLVHIALPWGLSLLSPRYGWVEGRPGWFNLSSLLLVVAGIAGAIWTMVLHYIQAPEGWELERTPKYLLSRGPYKFTRNPMFLAELVLWLGWVLFYGSIAVLAGFSLFWVAMNFLAVPREERDLEARFGEAYRQYKSKVPRWLGKPRN